MKLLSVIAIAALPVMGMSRAFAVGTPGASVAVVGKKTAAARLEARDRSVDQVALAAQESALARLQDLLKRYAKSDQEPQLLSRLAEAWQESAAIRFRIAHGRAHRTGAALNLTEFEKAMRSSIATLDRLVTNFPTAPDLHEAYFMRAKAFDEISSKAEARRDYLYLVNTFPQSSNVTKAHMRLAEYSIEDNDHVTAVRHLEEVEKRPDDPQFPFALYKLAWSHYNLAHTKLALKYLERHVAFYAALKAEKAADEPNGIVNPLQAEDALKETSLMDIALFYYDGLEKKNPELSLEGALEYFRSVEKGPMLGRMLSRYARLLRAGRYDAELEQWKSIVLKHEITRPESLDVVTTIFDDRLQKRQYGKMGELSADFVHIYKEAAEIRKSEAFEKARQLLLENAESLQQLTVKNKGATEVNALVSALNQLYMSFTQIVDSTDPRVPKAHFNLAETYFQLGQFDKATEHYRWSVENWKDPKTFDVNQSALRAISARYQILRGRGLIPQSLAARSVQSSASSVDASLSEWIAWIDAYAEEEAKPGKDFLNYAFEANRALYAVGRLDMAGARFMKFVSNYPESEFAVPSASLVVDTLVASEQWSRTHELSKKLAKTEAWKGNAFVTRLEKLEADTYYKMAEARLQAKDFEGALEMAQTCLVDYAKSEREADCRLLVARNYLAQNKEAEAKEHFTKLIERSPASAAAEAGLFSRARIAESHYDYAGAARDYRAYAERASGANDVNMRERVVLLSWLSSDLNTIAPLLTDKRYCGANTSGTLTVTCDRLKLALWIEVPELAEKAGLGKAAELLMPAQVAQTSRETQAFWALSTLRWNAQLTHEERLKLLESVAVNWDKSDALLQFQALPGIATTVRDALKKSREFVASESALKPTKKSIKKRIERIEELEGVETKLVKLPWARVRSEVLNESAESYADLSAQLRAMPAPKDIPQAELANYAETLGQLAMPFEEKAQEIRQKAFELASKSRVEIESYERISTLFFRDNPSQAKKLKSVEDEFRRTPILGRATLEHYDPAGLWNTFDASRLSALAADSTKKETFLRWSWWKALEGRQYGAAAWWLKEARDSKLSDDTLTLMKALSLAAVGQRAEAHGLLQDLKPTAPLQAPVVTAVQISQAGGAR